MGAYLLAVLALCLSLFGCKGPAGPHELTVAAAASLRGVMPGIAADFAKTRPSTKVTLTYGSSGELREQVESGAPVDVVVLASDKPVDRLVQSRLADGSTRAVVATNALVLIGPKGSKGDGAGKRATFATLGEVAPGEKIAIGNPATVPAGQYAEAALRALGAWDAVQGRLVLAGDVSAVLAYVRHGEVVAGVVYKTELHGIHDVDVLDELPPGTGGETPKVVAAAITGSRLHEDALAFVGFLKSPPAQKALADWGFGVP